jgi:MIP family channel proteins
MQDRGPAAYVAEFVGTFILVFSITAAVSGALVPGAGPAGITVVALVHGFALFLLVQTLAIVSGAHFNPAVTVALTALRQIKPSDAAIYIVVQVLGAIAAALVVKVLFGSGGNADAVNYGAPAVSDVLHGSTGRGMLGEFIGTFFLLFAIVGVAVNPRADKTWAALVIGLTLSLGVLIFGGLTGASLNPARGFGPSLVSGEFDGFGKFLLVYVLAPILGGLGAAAAYFNLVMAPGKKEPGGIEPVG